MSLNLYTVFLLKYVTSTLSRKNRNNFDISYMKLLNEVQYVQFKPKIAIFLTWIFRFLYYVYFLNL